MSAVKSPSKVNFALLPLEKGFLFGSALSNLGHESATRG